MGFLEVGEPLTWEEALKYIKFVRDHGIKQFINVFTRVKVRARDELLWGDEIEYHTVRFDREARTAKLVLSAPANLEALDKAEAALKAAHEAAAAEGKEDGYLPVTWHPEWGAWMIEATPGGPYGGTTEDLHNVERNMAARLERMRAVMPATDMAMSMVAYPLMGVGDFTVPSTKPGGPIANSAYTSDAIISPHPRFGTLVRNIRVRRGENVRICVPLYRDVKTVMPAAPCYCGPCTPACTAKWEPSRPAGKPKPAAAAAALEDDKAPSAEALEAASAAGGGGGKGGSGASAAGEAKEEDADAVAAAEALAKIGKAMSKHDSAAALCNDPSNGSYIHMDAMAFGMGACCLQVTFQARDLDESLRLYDQLGVLAPIMMALSAASPVFKGRLADTDVRWQVISASVDDRTPHERGVPAEGHDMSWMELEHADNSAGKGRRRIGKSRYDGIDCFISTSPLLKPEEHNDIAIALDEEHVEELKAAGVDELLARHVAHLFARDPLVVFNGKVEMDDATHGDHWESLQSTNWQSVRWKPPPVDNSDIGWRVELRTMEVQPSPFENAAYTVITVLLCRVILFFDLSFYIPISKVDENMATAHEREAAHKGRFWFRRNVVPLESKCAFASKAVASAPGGDASDPDAAYELMSAEEILLGKGAHFPGLFPLIKAYLRIIECDDATMVLVDRYMRLLTQRATGETMTVATWMRTFIRGHKDYKMDSVVPESTAYDLMQALAAVQSGASKPPELVGRYLHGASMITSPAAGSARPAGGAAGGAGGSGEDGDDGVKHSASRRLRGASFAEEVDVGADECDIVASLMERYSVRGSFKSTPAFLAIDTSEFGDLSTDPISL